MTVEYDIEVPAFYDKDRTEFRRNESTWCYDNMAEELTALVAESDRTDGPCLCYSGKAHCEYLGDTSEPFLKE